MCHISICVRFYTNLNDKPTQVSKTSCFLCSPDSALFPLHQVYKKLGQTHLALMNFSWAMDLDPKGANNQIKEAIDKRYLPDDEGSAAHPLDDQGCCFIRVLHLHKLT